MKWFRILAASLMLVCVLVIPAFGSSGPVTIDSLSADQWMAQSSANMQKANSYQGSVDMSMAMTVNGIPNQPGPTSMNFHAVETMFMQMNPMVLYARQTVDMSGIPGIPPAMSKMVNETMLKDNAMYTNVMGSGWQSMDMGTMNFQDIINTYYSQDPAKLIDQMRQYGIQCSFAQPITTINGKEYVVIDVTADPVQLMQQVKTILDQLGPSLQGQDAAELEQFLNTMNLDLSYRMYIDRAARLPDKADMNIRLGMSVPNPDNPAQTASMDMTMSGTASYFGWGQSFALPDVSKAVPLNNAPTAQIML